MISAYGGSLVDLRANADEFAELLSRAKGLRSLQLTPQTLGLLELLATGAFSPLDRFLGEAGCRRAFEEMRLEDGTLFPAPITMSVLDLNGVKIGDEVALRSSTNNLVASMRVDELFQRAEGDWCLTGPLKVLDLPAHTDFAEFRRAPRAVREALERMGKREVVAFQSTGWAEGSDEGIDAQLAGLASGADTALLLQPVIEHEDQGDADRYLQLRAYVSRLEKAFHAASMVVSLLPLGRTPGGARELILRLIVARNYGATQLLLSGPYSRRELALEDAHAQEIGVRLLEPEAGRAGRTRSVPSAPAATHQSGFCIWITGLPSSGKSTLAQNLSVLLMERGRQVTLLDGDVVRTHLSKGLGFSREDRDTNIRRIGFVASEIVRHHGAAICAVVSPYRDARDDVRAMMREGAFVEVYVDTPAEVCEFRDVKGYYAKARKGELRDFTGVDAPYEAPLHAEFRVDTVARSAKENALLVVQYLCERGLLREAGNAGA